MGSLRVLYVLDGVQKYENIDTKEVEYNGRTYVDEYGMLQNAELYGEALKTVGARNIKIEWDFGHGKSGKSRAM
jgi:hypothetical protein